MNEPLVLPNKPDYQCPVTGDIDDTFPVTEISEPSDDKDGKHSPYKDILH